MQDHEIVSLYFARDERAIGETQTKYGTLCRTLAMRILDDAQDSEECVNDTWLETWNTIPPHRPDSLQAYVCRIVRCLSLDRLRRRTRRKRSGILIPLEEIAECLPDTDTEPDNSRLPELMESFLASLSADDRRLFLGRYWHGYSPARLADAYGLTKNAVNLRIKRLRDRLRDHLAKGGIRV